ncbi:MAG TPA: hypothetical protein VKF32_06035, partial [Thermoanaerobaculia bacterium]|nr:hypothetical protein [Thermoanaerobaculia bacterium]
AAEAWSSLDPEARDFLAFTAAPPALWLLDPANMRGFCNQFLLQSPPSPAGPVAQWRALGVQIPREYVPDPFLLSLFAAGLAAAFLSKGTLRAMAAHAVWPVALMPLSPCPVEARFLGSLMPLAMTASACGAAAFLARAPAPMRRVAYGSAALALALGAWRTEARFREDVRTRVAYRYPHTPDEVRFLKEMEGATTGTLPIYVALPDDVPLSPTLRLVYRLRFRDLPPDAVNVDVCMPAEMLQPFADSPYAEAAVFIPSDPSRSLESFSGTLRLVSAREVAGLPGKPAVRMWRVMVARAR